MATVLLYCTQIIKVYKQWAILLLFVLFVFSSKISFSQTNYYYKGSGALSTTTNWGTNTDGTGTAPSNFTANNQLFNIRNTSSVSLTTTWTISGTSSQVIVENGVTLITSTSSNMSIGASTKLVINNGGVLQSDVAVTINSSGTFQVDNGGTYIHNNTTATSSSIFQGTESFGASSSARIDKWSAAGTAVDNAVTLPYGNLEINWTANSGIWQQSWSTTFTLCAGNFKITSTGSGSFAFTTKNAYTITVSGDYIVNGGTLDLGTSNGANTIADMNVAGNITQTAGTYTRTGNAMFLRLNATGTGTNTWTFSGGTRYLMLYTVASGKTINLASDFNMGSGVGSTQILLITGTLDAAGYIISYGTAGQGITQNGIIRTSNVNGIVGSSSTTISNTVSITLYIGTGSTIEYYATGSQTVTAVTIYENVIISGTGTKQLQGASNIYKTLTLSSGGNKLDIANYILSIESTGSISGYSSSNYIITGSGAGRLRQNGLAASTARVFPIGTSSCYMPATVTPGAASSAYSANVFTGATTNGTSGGTAWPNKSGMVDAVWNVDRNTGSGSDVVKLNWDNCYSSLEGSDFSAASNSSIGIWRWVSGTSWSLAATNFTSDNSNAGGYNTSATNTSTIFNGPYTAAIITFPLDINITSLNARIENKNNVLLNWEVKGDINEVSSFEVERSLDKIHFAKAGEVKGNNGTDYTFTDYNLSYSEVFYRVKIFDKSGKFNYSNEVSVKINGQNKIYLLGNPVKSVAVLSHPKSANAFYRILSTDGKKLAEGKINPSVNASTIDVAFLHSGVFFLQFIIGNNIENIKFIKE